MTNRRAPLPSDKNHVTVFAISEYAQPDGRESRYAITIQIDSEGHEMDELDDNKLKAEDNEREVESEEISVVKRSNK